MKLFGRNRSPKPPLALELRSSKQLILTSICVAIFTVRGLLLGGIYKSSLRNLANFGIQDLFLYGVIVPVIPSAIHDRAGIPQEDVQRWVSILLAVYGAAVLVASPFTGWLADHTSRRLPFLIGLLALAASTAILMTASNIAMFIVGRICQGMSAAVVWSVGLALLVDTVDQEETGQMLGTTGIAMGLGLLLAPLLGGIVFSRAGYYAVYGMCFGLLAVDIALRLVMIEKQEAAKWIKDDSHPEPTQQQKPEGTRPTDEERADGENTESSVHQVASHTHSIASTTGGVAERSQAFLVLLSSRRVLATLWAALAVSILITAFDAVLPIFVTTTFHWDSLGAGLIFLPIAIPSFLEPIAGWLADRYGSRWLATGGLVCTVPLLVLLRFVTHDSTSQVAVLCVLLFFLGLFMNGIMTPVLAELTFALRDMERDRPGLFGKKGAYAQTYSLFNIAFAGGSMLGPILAGLIRDASDWPTMTWSLSIIAAFTSITTALWLGPPGSGPRLWPK